MNQPVSYYVEALLQNNEQVLKQLYTESIPSITAYIVRNSGTDTDALDIFQEALLAIYQKARTGELHIHSGFQPYLYAVCRNLWLMQLRKKAVRRVANIDERQQDIATDSFAEAEQTANQYARMQLIETQLQQLGEGCRKLLKLAWSGKPLEEVASILNNTYAYIRKKKSECMGKLVALVKDSSEYHHLKW
jgi:RNA polymerase sigma factor (sigma-70 family)